MRSVDVIKIYTSKKNVIMEVLSRYNHIFVSKEGRHLLYNSEINSFVELSKLQYEAILQFGEDRNVEGLLEENMSWLRNNRIIVEDNHQDDYYNKVKFLTRLDCFSYDVLTLNIIPTTACNFSCPYCFEKNKPVRVMSDKVIEDLCLFVKKNNRAKKLSLMWYGGEPLLAVGVMKKILDKMSHTVHIPIATHSMITNGYCVNDTVCQLFQKYPLDDVQITLDGIRERHNKTRFIKANGNTFDTIVRNIGVLLDKIPTCHVHVRINIDENNKQEYHLVTEELRSLYHTDRLTFYPGFIRIEDKEERKMEAPSILGESKRNFFFDLEGEGEAVNFYPVHRAKMCSATKLNSYIVGPDGEFYKCWNDVGYKDRIIGYITEEKLANQSLLLRYLLDGTMFEDEKCRECFFFPICGGGCPQYRLRNKFNKGKYNLCSTFNDGSKNFDYLNKCLEEHYNNVSRSKILKIGE